MARYLLDSILNLAVGPGLIPAEKRGKQAQERSSGSPPQILKSGVQLDETGEWNWEV